jgi:hypothetical protein
MDSKIKRYPRTEDVMEREGEPKHRFHLLGVRVDARLKRVRSAKTYRSTIVLLVGVEHVLEGETAGARIVDLDVCVRADEVGPDRDYVGAGLLAVAYDDGN